jgi:hypothetical protein
MQNDYRSLDKAFKDGLRMGRIIDELEGKNHSKEVKKLMAKQEKFLGQEKHRRG